MPSPPRSVLQNYAGQRGAPSGQLSASWLSDLVALGKAVVLCSPCQRKYSQGLKKAGYVAAVRPPFNNGVYGDCDACGTANTAGKLFLGERNGSNRPS